MEDSIADLSLEDDDEETIQLGVESLERETSYANYFLGMFLTSSVVNFQVMRSTLANVWHLIEGEGEDPLSIQLNWVDFWMIIHDLPLGFMSKAIAKQLGSFIGVFLEYDASATQLSYKRIIRINVQIDVRKPLKRKKNLTLSNGKSIYVRFKYEKLTLFCFLCGKIGHDESFCLIRAHNPWQEYVFHSDIYLRAQSRKILA
ncbi:hypothetical protein Godav_022279 [Gossypium davidsonii]|uniref:Zinc knuckle CX2CX4HX4C domain-containing protein n=1 Tax=Gossypium davidsonii TaxID=34287 RepID=A0A7J8TIA2_GOSDV|nr:hypothetical protein [Gossypium davidsonii]